MKLLEKFKQQLAGMGELKNVWLTTFNLDIAFVEKTVLPAILKMDPPVSRIDYEILQQALTESGIDFRIYCDPRMVAREKPKRSSINIYPVSMRQLAEGDAPHAHYLDAENSFFHPKVFYLEDHNKKIVVGAGSANLTLSGWGRNQESVDFRCISRNEQYQQVKKFFIHIDSSLASDEFFPVRRKFHGEDNEWSFIHSLSGQTLMEALGKGEAIKTLSVWSPYLAADMAGFIASLLEPEQCIELVPDRVNGFYIRTRWDRALQTLLDEGQLTLCHSPLPRDERAPMTHAKLWLGHTAAGKQLAVGSWNFTAQGCCSLDEKGWNVEAGIVHSVVSSTKLCGPAWLEVTESDFASEAQLQEEYLNVVELPPCDINVIFDWTHCEYLISGKWGNGRAQSSYQLVLPGINKPCELLWKKDGVLKTPKKLVVRKTDALLNNPFYILRTADKSDWHGMINEKGVEHRRALSFASLDDLLNSYLSDADPTVSEYTILRGNEAQDQTLGEGATIPESSFEPSSYFRLFQAIQRRRERLIAEEDIIQLHRHLFNEPGCLLELAEFTREHTEQSKQLIFNWFLTQEVNSLAVLGKKRFKQLRCAQSKDLSIAAHQWEWLQVNAPELTMDAASERYLTAIREICGYGA